MLGAYVLDVGTQMIVVNLLFLTPPRCLWPVAVQGYVIGLRIVKIVRDSTVVECLGHYHHYGQIVAAEHPHPLDKVVERLVAAAILGHVAEPVLPVDPSAGDVADQSESQAVAGLPDMLPEHPLVVDIEVRIGHATFVAEQEHPFETPRRIVVNHPECRPPFLHYPESPL